MLCVLLQFLKNDKESNSLNYIQNRHFLLIWTSVELKEHLDSLMHKEVEKGV